MAYNPKAGEVSAESKGSVFDEQFGAASTPAQGSVFEGGDLHTRGPQGAQGIGIKTVSGEIQEDGNTLVTVTTSNPASGATPGPGYSSPYLPGKMAPKEWAAGEPYLGSCPRAMKTTPVERTMVRLSLVMPMVK